MRRGRIFIYLALILIFGLVAIFLVGRSYIFPATEEGGGAPVVVATPTPQTTVDVVVVEQSIGRGNLVEEGSLTLVPYPEDLVLPGMVTSMDMVIGKLARFDLDPGLIMTTNMVVDSLEALGAEGSDAAIRIPPGMVAVSIPINRLSSVSYAPRRGDHVNVIVTLLFVDLDTGFQTRLPNNTAAVIAPGLAEQLTYLTAQLGVPGAPYGHGEIDTVLEQTFYTIPSEAQRPRPVSQTFLQNVIVLQIGNFQLEAEEKKAEEEEDALSEVVVGTPTPQPTPIPGVVEEEKPLPPPPDVITLIVSPQDAVTLNYLIYSGAQLTLALRSPKDDTTVTTEAVTLQFLLDQYDIPIPVKLPYGMEPRIDQLVLPTLVNQPTPTP